MRIAPIKQLFRIIGGKPAPKGDSAFSDEGTPFIKMKDLGRAHFSSNLVDIDQRVSDAVAKKEGLNLIRRGSILLPRSGSVALNHRAVLGTDAYMVGHICALEVIDPKEVSNLYAYYYLRSIKMDRISKKTTGLDAITFEDLGNLTIPLPGIDDQIRIAHLLGKVEELIARRKQHLQQLEDLLKSVFLQMFGDPVLNEMGWDKVHFSELLADIESGKSPKCEARRADPDEWGVLKLSAVTRCKFDDAENKALPKEVSPSVRDEVKAGDLLFSRKNTYELVAACAYVFQTRTKLLMPDLIFRFVFKEGAEINPIFIWKLLTCDSQRKAIQSLAAGAAGSMPNISKANLKTVRLPTPPLLLQNEFATIVKKVEGIKFRYQQSLSDLEALYGSLSQRAFKGELNLSRVVLPAATIDGEKRVVAAASTPITTPVIELPENDLLLPALQDRTQLAPLLRFWLEVYRRQLGSAAFSLERFIVAAQTRLAELHPENDFSLGSAGYDVIKNWVFNEIDNRRLKQTRDIILIDGKRQFGNQISLRARRLA